ncbi:hypothetical protein HPB49_009410 [Dermacentor silvarum]|uniref:Uncharacterized protein n=1 Tax=Dermacentor silvarum TaxID=543639 RepID=A0ACB8DYK4_DERSI|nr:hypothetical protein HPB49_009410 [Dermacentor silvarum]
MFNEPGRGAQHALPAPRNSTPQKAPLPFVGRLKFCQTYFMRQATTQYSCSRRACRGIAHCIHVQLYRDSKERCKQGPTKASLSLAGCLGLESGFTLDKESHTMALICPDLVLSLAFDSRELLIQWQVKIRANVAEVQQFLVQIWHAPGRAKLASGPARLHLQDHLFCMTSGVPPRLLGSWPLKELRRFGLVDGKFCFEGGSKCGKGALAFLSCTKDYA